MKYFLALVLILINFFSVSSFDEDCKVIYWDELSILDFKHFKLINEDAVPEETTVAQSKVGVRVYVEFKGDTVLASVRAEFCRNSNSFIYRDFYNDKETLLHEQVHFDICEFWARRLRKIYQTNYKSSQEFYDGYDIEYAKILDSVEVYHKIIDDNYWYEDTNERSKWIRNKINKLNDYSNPMIKLSFKSNNCKINGPRIALSFQFPRSRIPIAIATRACG